MKSDLLQDAIGLVRDEYIEDAHAETSEERTKVSAYRQTGKECLRPSGQMTRPRKNRISRGKRKNRGANRCQAVKSPNERPPVWWKIRKGNCRKSFGQRNWHPSTRERINQLRELYVAAYYERCEVRRQRYGELKDSGMSSKEAFARIYTDPLFVEWREKTLAANREWKMARMQAQYETQREALDRLLIKARKGSDVENYL